ncbi:ABC transporter ATP-binding protein [Cellulomonas dongxiuzhuiae]|uniref:ABC transporter ATP-binding protein n=1 Tax=Cellulomonas dongxiuzhuiae TaxID=2819979 RepID=A0ABX8GJW6_9CELL|nr:ABC transporter ATP-binding protein [Cellulomonas dongxiuzhuiae]MBO3095243.1 ABC transporter ATP-binding protein [Cellulomonas dongxiuzhuiae]QWC16240.1 ABC transporter ATP-binding protein [Cellulomonas dongxiuzhuiae]
MFSTTLRDRSPAGSPAQRPRLRAEEPAPGADLLRVQDLTVRYGGPDGATAVRDVSFDIGRGERIALVGESGSGKTTLAMAVAGFLPPEAHVTTTAMEFAGRSISDRRPGRLPRRTPGMAMVFQDAMTSLDPVWSVGSQLLAVLRADGRASRSDDDARARDWLRRVGLTDLDRVMRARPYELSGGMRQRVMMALALCGQPRLLIADEPTSALDASLARATMDLLLELTSTTQTSLLIVSHDIHLCLDYSDRTFVMYQGDLVEQAASADLASRARHPYTQGLLRCIPTLADVGRDYLPTLDAVMAESRLAVAAGGELDDGADLARGAA